MYEYVHHLFVCIVCIVCVVLWERKLHGQMASEKHNFMLYYLQHYNNNLI